MGRGINLWGDYVIASNLTFDAANKILESIPSGAKKHLSFQMISSTGDSGWVIVSRPKAVCKDFIANPDAYYMNLVSEDVT